MLLILSLAMFAPHLIAPFAADLTGGSTLGGIAEGQKFPYCQLQRDKPSLTCGQHVPREWASLLGKGRDRESQIHPARGESKQMRRKQSILANFKYLIYQVQHHQSGTLPQTFLPVAHGLIWPKIPAFSYHIATCLHCHGT